MLHNSLCYLSSWSRCACLNIAIQFSGRHMYPLSSLVIALRYFRKRILSRIEATEEPLLAELRLAGMVLAYGPKSEESWAYRSVFSSKNASY